ncbi:MAG TPA: hypothetical protein P5052_01605 [Candidatus Paceibacterota bacterium]|nr:hypothetical protein [Candidatus Paceibacterota bacterium]HRZ29458.1 hypothetical protein [Candidatus Paceibacterota bacterium]
MKKIFKFSLLGNKPINVQAFIRYYKKGRRRIERSRSLDKNLTLVDFQLNAIKTFLMENGFPIITKDKGKMEETNWCILFFDPDVNIKKINILRSGYGDLKVNGEIYTGRYDRHSVVDIPQIVKTLIEIEKYRIELITKKSSSSPDGCS